MKPPSLRLRALLALALLVGFYLVTFTVAAFLFAAPPLLLVFGDTLRIGVYILFLFALGWIPAGSLVYGALSVRPPKFASKGKLLARTDAPELFAALEEIGRAARTTPPSQVYLEILPEMGVLETGGFLGFGSKRVLLLGAPYLETVTVQELRAILAHELGHFAGGETRLGGLLGYTEAAFRCVIEASTRSAFREGTSHAAIELGFAAAQAIGTGLVRTYARLYFLLMLPASRRQELAADALAARVAGREAAIRALERSSALMPYYRLYLDGEVGQAIGAGGMPTDLLDGFGRFRARFARSEPARALEQALREEKTSRYDTHPALAERIARLRTLEPGPSDDDTRPASTLVDRALIDEWLVDATMYAFQPKGALKKLPWTEIHAQLFDPNMRTSARKVAALLFPLFPAATTVGAMFAAVARDFEARGTVPLACALEPRLGSLRPAERLAGANQLGADVVMALFQGALLERGAKVTLSLGARCIGLELDGEVVEAASLALEAMRDDAARGRLLSWAQKLDAAG